MSQDPKSVEFICLACSKKFNAFCIAGKQIFEDGTIGKWVRPMDGNQVIENRDRAYSAGLGYAEPLDLVSAVYLRKIPNGFQSENILIDTGYYWAKLDSPSPIDIDSLLDYPASLWIDGYHSSNGRNDRIPVEKISLVSSSLYFIKISNLKVISEISFEKLKVRADFYYNKIHYNFTITDPNACEAFKEEGTYSVGDCYATVSLGVEFNENHYKLIAFLYKA